MIERVLTIGPASEDPANLFLLRGAATRFRLNTAHLSSERLTELLQRLSDATPPGTEPLPVILDLQGAKIRLGRCPHGTLPLGEITLHLREETDTLTDLPLPHPEVFQQTRVGDILFLNDRRVTLEITAKTDSTTLRAVCRHPGEIGPGKGVNSPHHAFVPARVTPGDQCAIAIGNRFPFVEYAVSFLATGAEADLFRPLTGDRRLIAKIERPLALGHLEGICTRFDEVWLCRGDLGAEVGWRGLGRAQAEFTDRIATLGKPALLAGGVLGSMVFAPHPSRSEVVHLHDALTAGFAGIVLSDETACGSRVTDVVAFLHEFFDLRKT
jgi:pyruvate kinase